MSWLERHSLKLTATMAVAVVVFGTIAVVVFFSDLGQRRQLGGVERVAPCRTAGIDNAECRRMSRLVIRSCLSQPKCRARLRGERPKTATPINPDKPDKGGSPDAPSSQPPPVPAPTGPSGGGGNPGSGGGVGSPGGDNPGGGSPPPNPPGPPPKPPAPPDRPTLGGAGVDVPLVDECNLAPVACK